MKKLIIILGVFFLFLIPINAKKLTFLQSVEVDGEKGQIIFSFTDDNYSVDSKDFPSQILLTFTGVRSELKWNYKLIKKANFTFIRLYQIGEKIKFIIGKKGHFKGNVKKVGKITLLSSTAILTKVSNFSSAPKKIPSKKSISLPFIEKISFEEYPAYYRLNFSGKNLPTPKLIYDKDKVVIIFLHTLFSKELEETIFIYKGPFTFVKNYRLKNSVRSILFWKKKLSAKVIKTDSGCEIRFIKKNSKKKELKTKKIIFPKIILAEIGSLKGGGDYLLLKGENLDKLSLFQGEQNLIIKGKIKSLPFISKKSKKFEYINFYRSLLSQGEYRLILSFKEPLKNLKLKVNHTANLLKIGIAKIKKINKENYSLKKSKKKITDFLQNIYLQRKNGKDYINVELDKPYKFDFLRADNTIILTFYGVGYPKEVPYQKWDNPILKGYRLVRAGDDKARLLLFLKEKDRKPVYFWNGEKTISIRLEPIGNDRDNRILNKNKSSKKVLKKEKKDELKKLISSLVSKKDVNQKRKKENGFHRGPILKKIILVKSKKKFLDLVLVLSEGVNYKKVVTGNQIIVFFKGKSQVKERTLFFYQGPIEFVRILTVSDLVRVVVILSQQVKPSFINTQDGIILRFPVWYVDEKKSDKILKKKVATLINYPANQEKESQDELQNPQIEEVSDFSLNKVQASLEEVRRKKKVDTLYNSALAKIKVDDYLGAYQDLNKALEISPYENRLLDLLNKIKPLYRVYQYLRKGREYEKNNQWAEAIFAYREALNLDPNNVKAQYLLQEALKMKELFDQYFRARIFYENSNYKEAEKILLSILQAKNDFKEGLYLLGKVYEDTNRFKLALLYFEKGKNFYPVDRDFRLACERVKLKERIKKLYEEGKGYENRKEWDQALLKYEEAVRLQRKLQQFSSSYTNRYLKEGYAAYLQQNLEEAEMYFKKVLSIDFDNVKAHYWLGKVYMDMGKVSLAAREFKKVSQLDPENKITNFEPETTSLSNSNTLKKSELPPLKLGTFSQKGEKKKEKKEKK